GGRFTSGAGGDEALNRTQGSALFAHPPRFAPGVPFAFFGSASRDVSGGVGTTTVSITLSSAATQTVTVPFSLGGSATQGIDYDVSAQQFVIPAGATVGSVTVTVHDDNIEEFNDAILFTLGTPTNAAILAGRDTFILTIVDNDFVTKAPPNT